MQDEPCHTWSIVTVKGEIDRQKRNRYVENNLDDAQFGVGIEHGRYLNDESHNLEPNVFLDECPIGLKVFPDIG